jgi:hypothetical protein
MNPDFLPDYNMEDAYVHPTGTESEMFDWYVDARPYGYLEIQDVVGTRAGTIKRILGERFATDSHARASILKLKMGLPSVVPDDAVVRLHETSYWERVRLALWILGLTLGPWLLFLPTTYASGSPSDWLGQNEFVFFGAFLGIAALSWLVISERRRIKRGL